MRFASLGSGSKGNATLIESGATLVMLDCGFSMKEAERRMALLDVSPSDLDALIVTHEHGDHIRGIGPLARKNQLPVYMTQGTARCTKMGCIDHHVVVVAGQTTQISDLEIMPVAVNHDAADPVQYRFNAADKSLAVITDLGSYGDELLDAFAGCQGLMLEANHDINMLLAGPYPDALITRVMGDDGHLNNKQAAKLFSELDTTKLQHMILMHLSETNNQSKLALDAFMSVNMPGSAKMTIADQDNGLHWRTLV